MNELMPKPKNDLQPLIEEASTALDRMDPVIQMFNRHNSKAQNYLMVVGAEQTPSRRLRQIAAELQKRQAALVEASTGLHKKKANIKIKEEELQKAEGAYKDLIQAEIQELKAQIAMTERPYKGALEGVLELQKLHDKTVAEIKAKYGEITDDILDKEEARYWVLRIFGQSLQDMRSSNHISPGNQAVLVRMGLDPNYIRMELGRWLEWRSKVNDPSSDYEFKFLSECADKWAYIVQERIDKMDRPDD